MRMVRSSRAGWCRALAALPCAILSLVPAHAADTDVPTLRLPTNAVPEHYHLDLTLVPSSATFRGEVVIDLDIKTPTSTVWLNGNGLTIASATLTSAGDSLPATEVPGGKDFVGFHVPHPVAVGKARLDIQYSGEISSIETSGLFRQREGENWYLFSQFESTDARRAFPCYDEPGYKTPWDLTLHIHEHDIAVANNPQVSETAEADGMKKVVFKTTPPLPSYLVALGVGPFEIIDAGHAGMNSTAIRIVAPQGHRAEATWAAQTAGPELDLLEKYVGRPYPFDKLDNLVIPTTVGFGAMENAGLVTYASSEILAKPENSTLRFRRNWVSVFAHETAHQWFGDFVTPKWWDDIWLNESFASWLGTKILNEYHPAWSNGVDPVAARGRAARSDTLITARQIRQPITSKHDIENAFDGITYTKGQSVLQMFEAWMGPANFQSGVQHYLAAHAFGNATADDFLEALAATGNHQVHAAFLSFLNQPGVPEVGVELDCKKGHAELELTQRRFLPLGSAGAEQQLWQVPVCVRFGEGKSAKQACTVLTEAHQALLLRTPRCPAWVLGNASGLGYYRVDYKGDLLKRLLSAGDAALTVPERVSVINDAAALMETGELAMGDALALVPVYGKNPEHHVVDASTDIANRLHDILPDTDGSRFHQFVESVYGERARQVGLGAALTDDDSVAFRESLVPFVAEMGDDHQLLAEANDLAHRWLADHQSVNPEAAGIVLRLAAIHGDAALFDAYHEAALKATDRRQRQQLLSALGSFTNPQLIARAQGLLLTSEFDSREVIVGIMGPRLTSPSLLEQRWEFLKTNFQALAAKLPRDYPARFPNYLRGFCDDSRRADVAAFFNPSMANYTGGPRTLSQLLEQISLCVAFKKAQLPSAETFLSKY
jgi:alanyl aminopeptidase